MTVREQATEGVINSLNHDGQEWVLESERVIVFYPSKKLARKMIGQGWFDNWIDDEEFYINYQNDIENGRYQEWEQGL